MKKFIKAILTLGVITGFILMTAEGDDMDLQMMWSFSWMAVMAICGYGLNKMTKEEEV